MYPLPPRALLVVSTVGLLVVLETAHPAPAIFSKDASSISPVFHRTKYVTHRRQARCNSPELLAAGTCFCFLFQNGKLGFPLTATGHRRCFVNQKASPFLNGKRYCAKFMNGKKVDKDKLFAKIALLVACLDGPARIRVLSNGGQLQVNDIALPNLLNGFGL